MSKINKKKIAPSSFLGKCNTSSLNYNHYPLLKYYYPLLKCYCKNRRALGASLEKYRKNKNCSYNNKNLRIILDAYINVASESAKEQIMQEAHTSK